MFRDCRWLLDLLETWVDGLYFKDLISVKEMDVLDLQPLTS